MSTISVKRTTTVSLEEGPKTPFVPSGRRLLRSLNDQASQIAAEAKAFAKEFPGLSQTQKEGRLDGLAKWKDALDIEAPGLFGAFVEELKHYGYYLKVSESR